MAETRPATYEQIMQELKKGNFAQVYYLMGEEPYYIDKVCDYIEAHALTEEERDFNQMIFYGSDTESRTIAEAARRYPMMAERQVIIVKEAQKLKGTEPLEAYMQSPMATTVLVFCHKGGTIDKRKKLSTLIQRNGILFESKKLKDVQLPGFIANYLGQKNATIDQRSQNIIADSVGADLTRLTGELDKLLVSLPDNGDRRITPEMVEANIGISKDFNVFEFKDSIINKDVMKANRIVNYFNHNPKAGDLYQVLPLLFKYFQTLMIAWYCPDRNNDDALADYLELRSKWNLKDYRTGMRLYSARKVMLILEKIREIDAKSKGLDNPDTPASELLQELVYFILH